MNKTLEPFYGISLGVVIQNNDPEMRGRVKIYTPEMAPYLDNTYSKNDNKNVDKFFNFLGVNTGNDSLNEILPQLKDKLPWAEIASPLFSGNASGRYNAFNKEGTTSDSSAWEGSSVAEGFRPVQNYIGANTPPDAFNTTNGHKNKFVNQYSYQYSPSNYSGLARGLFSVPSVGAHVWVFYIGGDRNFPVYFASAYSQEDVQRIFTMNQDSKVKTSPDYPATYENVSSTEGATLNEDTKTYRSKVVFNTNKHTIELIDTDLREILKFTHYSGSFKEFNNYANIELATNNDQKLVMGDQFHTVNRNKSEYIKVHSDLIVGGDQYINVGETDQSIVKQILDLHKEVHDYKMLFDIQRAEYGETTIFGNPNILSTKQKRSGFTGIDETGTEYKDGFVVCPLCKNKMYNPYDPSYRDDGDVTKMWKEAVKYAPLQCTTAAVLETNSTEAEVTEAGEVGSTIWGPTCHSFTLDGLTEEQLAEVSELHPLLLDDNNSYAESAESLLFCAKTPHPFTGLLGYYRGMKCALCGGTGFSPSSENGNFFIETAKTTLMDMDQKILSNAAKMAELEAQLGEGGDSIETVSMNKVTTIGLVMNDMTSYRIDAIGKLKSDGCYVSPQGTYTNYKVSPHVEYVDVADIPGGDYNLTCMNKYKLLVGAKGVNIQTYGPIDIYGSIINITGEQINIGSQNEVVIDGGERFSLRARKISLNPVEHNAVVVEGQLHVTRNVVIEGGTMMEGEVGLLHITCPAEWHETEPALWGMMPECSITVSIPALLGSPTTLIMPPHTHWIQGIPFDALPHPEAVRESMIVKGINSREKIAAASVADSPSSNCSSSTQDIVNNGGFLEVAWEKAKEDGSAYFDPADDWAYYDTNENYKLAGGPIGQSPTMSCKETTDSEGNVTSTDITVVYVWSNGKYAGTVTVEATIDAEGNLTSGPK